MKPDGQKKLYVLGLRKNGNNLRIQEKFYLSFAETFPKLSLLIGRGRPRVAINFKCCHILMRNSKFPQGK